ncbi:MAG: RNA polymerase factor sigma-54 [Bacteroidaceae bacterium]|nr:RNA polymerase factor sigma-54 [Bacteroidaceae bacterium]MBR1379209.1 RNA polymerase factor sigma-54 [Bacteroidaceae bacterium]MBR1379956.1 RNA polymerase factor sigma-54 [Bacteroidaceae bacterium]
MNNSQVQIQQQTERQLQKLTPQQLLNARLIELPLVEFEDRVKTELLDNIALEEGHDSTDDEAADIDEISMEPADKTSLDAEETGVYDVEDIPVYTSKSNRDMEEDRPIGDTKSFIDDLYNQISDFNVTDRQREIIEVLIGSLDANGFIDRNIAGISDDLLFKFNIDATKEDIEKSIHTLQKFEPAGIGARNLQECLLIQVDRQLADTPDRFGERYDLLSLERTILSKYFDLFKHQNVEQLAIETGASPDMVGKALLGLSHLNPRPGLALNESSDMGYQAIVPDFIIDTTPDGNINIELNHGEVPDLKVSRDYSEQLEHYRSFGGKLGRGQQEAFEYTRMKVEAAKMFIDSVRQRQHTLLQTMRAIVRLQRDFILSLDEQRLNTMRLVDVAQLAHVDVSTVSRVRKNKYALIDGQLYPLSFFFLRSRTNADGEALQHEEVKQALREMVDAEDKAHPYTDQTLESMLRQRGMNISRRTVAKYRREIGIETALVRQRK